MTSPRKDHANLEVVSQRPRLSVAPELEDDWREQSVFDEWSAEHQLVGALMWLTAAQARLVLELVPDIAIFRPHTRWVYELIRRAVDAGQNPSPVVVLDAGRRYSGSDALNPEQPPSSSEHCRLALYLFEVYQSAVAPTDTVDTYAAMVLDDAYRRAFTLCGIRMQQLGEAGAERTDLNDQFIAIRDELADLRRRADKAAKHEKSPK